MDIDGTTTSMMNIDNNDTNDEMKNNSNNHNNNNDDEVLSLLMKKLQVISDVIVHPLVLLSVADHYHRVARGTRKRVIGILLGQSLPGGTIDITNSFALPFEEDSKNPAIFYLDHNYLESMFHMFRKVNAKERIVGFYSTGPQIRSNDLRIYDIVERYTSGHSSTTTTTTTSNSTSTLSSIPTYPAIFSIIDIRPDRSDLPVTSYTVTEQVNTLSSSSNNNNNNKQQRTIERIFVHVPTTLGAVEAEEVGVEHLLRDIHDPTISTIASLIQEKVVGLQTLHSKLLVCQQYVQSCIATTSADGSTTGTNAKAIAQINPTILSNLQTIISLLPNTMAITDQLHHRSMMQQTNDMYMSMYIASLIRTVMALHDLINNQIKYGTDGNTDMEKESNDIVVDATSKSTSSTSEKNTTTSNEEKKE